MPRKSSPKTPAELAAEPLGAASVNISNQLARGVQNLTLAEKRLVALAIAKTDSVPAASMVKAIYVREGWRVSMTASEYAESYDVDTTTAYEQLRGSARSLLKKTWRVDLAKDGHRGTIREGNYFSIIEYNAGEGRVDVKFTPDVGVHLLALRKQFTTYKLRQAGALRSLYAWRLLECLKSWKARGYWRVKIADFHRAMETPQSLRADFGNLRLRVIEPCLRELRDKSALLVKCEYVKAGRKVTELLFTFHEDPQQRLELEP
jgi:plasmid replication initiation protein